MFRDSEENFLPFHFDIDEKKKKKTMFVLLRMTLANYVARE